MRLVHHRSLRLPRVTRHYRVPLVYNFIEKKNMGILKRGNKQIIAYFELQPIRMAKPRTSSEDVLPPANLIVVCLEGCHGCGKTSVCAELRKRGVNVLGASHRVSLLLCCAALMHESHSSTRRAPPTHPLCSSSPPTPTHPFSSDEGFMNMPDYALHPQSLLMETSWVCSWFTRLLKHNAGVEEGAPPRAVFVDRSPFSAVFYASNATGSLLTPVIRQHIVEMRAVGIEIVSISLQVEREMLWKRICDRLEQEPERMRFNEASREWMETTLDFYESFEWDEVVAIGDDSPQAVVTRVLDCVAERCPHARDVLTTPLKVDVREPKDLRDSFSPISIADLAQIE